MIYPTLLKKLDGPLLAPRKANLKGILVLDILIYKPKAWLLQTRHGNVWMPVSCLYYDPKASKPQGLVLFAPNWACEEKFGVQKKKSA